MPEFVRAWLKDSDKLPNVIPCRDVGVELYLRLGQWKNIGVFRFMYKIAYESFIDALK